MILIILDDTCMFIMKGKLKRHEYLIQSTARRIFFDFLIVFSRWAKMVRNPIMIFIGIHDFLLVIQITGFKNWP